MSSRKTARGSARDLEAGLGRIRPYARAGMLEWTRGDSLLHALGEMLDPQGVDESDASLRDVLLGARVETPETEGDAVPVLLLREARALDSVVAAAVRRLVEGGLLLILLDDGDEMDGGSDLERRAGECVAALSAEDGLQLRERPRHPGDRFVSATRANRRPRVALLPDGPGACLQIRTLGPLEALEARGLLELTLLPTDADAQRLAGQDLLMLQRFGGLPAVRMLLAARRMGVPVALELDDDFFNLPWYNPCAKTFRKFENRAMLSALLRGVDTVVTSTPYLQQRMREYNDDVRTMHNLVDTELFKKIRGPYHEPGVTTFGYIGTKTHSEDLRPVLGPLRDLILESAGTVRAVFIGHVPEELSRLPGVRYLGWFGTYQNAALALSRSGANVALAPLADLEFNRSKSAMKYLEYGACGIPGIFSDVEAYRGFVRHGDNGLLVREHTPDAWGSAMREMVNDPERRRRLAESAHGDVLDAHSIERRAGDFLELYRGILLRPNRKTEFQPVTRPKRPVALSVVLNLFGDAQESLPAIAGIADSFPEETQWVVVAEHDELSDLLQLSGIVDLVPGHARNDDLNGIKRALELARGDWVLCLEQGCSLPADLLDRLLPLTAPDIGAIGTRAESPISAQSISRIIDRGDRGNLPELLRAFARETPATPATWLEPGCVLLQRQAVAACGGIDGRLTWGDALIDVCVRLHAQGHKVLVANGVLIASGARHRSSHASPGRRRRSRERLAGHLASRNLTVGTEKGCDPTPVHGLSGERLDVWVWARGASRYLDECLRRVEAFSDLPLTLNVVHDGDHPLIQQAIERYSAVSHPARAVDGNPLLAAALAESGATHAVLLHDGVMVTPGWLREMLTILEAGSVPAVVPFASDGSPEQRWVVDRGLSLDTLDDMARSRLVTRSDEARPIQQAGGFCILLDLVRLRRAGTCTTGSDPSAMTALTVPREASDLLLAPRAYVHVLSHPVEAAAMRMGAFRGGPFDVDLPAVPPAGCPALTGKAFLHHVRPLLAALRESPGNATILAALGRLYLHQGEIHNAMPFLERARRMDPFCPRVREAIRAAREALDGASVAP